MIVLNSQKSNILREQYIENFVDFHSDYYNQRIKNLVRFSDGFCYIGYLWDCIKHPMIISEAEATKVLKNKRNIYIMWDIHTCERIFIPNYWKYPKLSIILSKTWTEELCKELPEDIYFFDETFSWSIIFTHETDIKGNRYCLVVESDKTGDGSMSCLDLS